MKKIMKIFTNALIFVCAGGIANAALDDGTYSGIYKKEFQLIPNTMATLCKISADDVVKDVQKLKDCVNKLALKRRSADADLSREGLAELNQVKADELKEMIALSAAKGAAVTGYFAITGGEANNVTEKSSSVNDVDASGINTTKVLTSVVNSLRDLYVEQLKSVAISNIENIEKDVLLEIASLDDIKEAEEQIAAKREEAKENSASGGSEENNSSGSSSEAIEGSSGSSDDSQSSIPEELNENDIPMEVRVIDGVCIRCLRNGSGKVECRQELCTDGEYPDANDPNIMYICQSGICEKVDVRTADCPNGVCE